MSVALGVDWKTMKKNMNEAGISRPFSNINDADLDEVLLHFHLHRPNSGYLYAQGYLRALELRVQRRRVRASLRRIDAVGIQIRYHQTIDRGQFVIIRPNALWACDGHHKLIAWGFVIHGFIDAYCHTVMS
ncbi:hypothetical protein SISNIDRAFT_419393 [Sistotremastrum niveocremeum HHB9708]|uniref:Integrase core domain-containing protein n=1 Tax=Sistotremastrum niveocremeum HHB9708 TaxID=1314777 RepID=A0A164NCP6_9AGAM|nr:hypothetical protein SISNIDRAFT_419393 [Sistotremastrum niveocremeum HHB9708]